MQFLCERHCVPATALNWLHDAWCANAAAVRDGVEMLQYLCKTCGLGRPTADFDYMMQRHAALCNIMVDDTPISLPCAQYLFGHEGWIPPMDESLDVGGIRNTAAHGSVELVRYIITCVPDSEDAKQQMLWFACARGRLQVVKMLVDEGHVVPDVADFLMWWDGGSLSLCQCNQELRVDHVRCFSVPV